jgi:DNA-binding CsgD family transcriptional regulator
VDVATDQHTGPSAGAVSRIAVLTALALAQEEHGGARSALRMTGLASIPLHGVPLDVGHRLDQLHAEHALDEAVALGFLAGRMAHRPRALELSSFLMDRDLVVRSAEGRSILRLPWFENDLFVARQLPDITEMPADVRRLAVRHYTAALGGERGRFEFTSYGHRFRVESIPVRGDGGQIEAVLGLARPCGESRLTPRELEVLQLAADGLSGPDIAELLVVSPGTVKTHFQNIYKKSGVSDRAGAVAKAMRQGLIS